MSALVMSLLVDLVGLRIYTYPLICGFLCLTTA